MKTTPVAVSPTLGTMQFLQDEAAVQLIGLLNHINPVLVAEGEDPITCTELGRSYARQLYYYEGYQKRLAGVPGYEGFNLAAAPWSPLARHVDYLAADLGQGHSALSQRAHDLLVSIGPRYGWEWTGKGFDEWWHFQYLYATRSVFMPRTVRLITDFTPKLPEENHEMIAVEVTQTTTSFRRGDKFLLSIESAALVSKATLQGAGILPRLTRVNKNQFRTILRDLRISEKTIRALVYPSR